MEQKAIIFNENNEIERKSMKIKGIFNYPVFIFKRLVERAERERIKYGRPIHPILNELSYYVKVDGKNINVPRNYFIVKKDGIILILRKTEEEVA